MTKGLYDTEIKDMEKASEELKSYSDLYSFMTYANEFYDTITIIQNWIITMNQNNGLNMLRSSSHNKLENMISEIDACLVTYYNVLEQLEGNEEW